jgi:dipeptidyl aminopeptidase/acylaminoacyl peptidase
MNAEQAASPTATAAAPTIVTGKQPPACTFPLAQITKVESQPEIYTFSEPQVVLTAPKENFYHIAEWLPDNQQVLMTEELRNVVIQNDTNLQETINLYNPETGQAKIYAIRPATNGAPPSWQTGLKAVVYPVMNYYDIDRKANIYKLARQIWISYGNPDTAQILADNLPQLFVTFKPGGSEMFYVSDKKIIKLDQSLKKLTSASFDFDEWDYGKERRDKNPVYYYMAWQPGTSLIFLYSDGFMGGGGYTFILDADSGRVCELDLGGWATMGRWSSDGRYLAIGRATDSHPADLTLLDSITGELITLDIPPQGVDGKFYISDFLWAPDNHHLLTLGNVYLFQNNKDGSFQEQGLYLVDFSGRNSYIRAYDGTMPPQDNNWAWSPDGSKVLVRCPTHEVDRLCLISVRQPNQ